jgi:hypothetical protein
MLGVFWEGSLLAFLAFTMTGLRNFEIKIGEKEMIRW